MAVVARKKKDPALALSKYPQYIIDLNKPDKPLKFYKEARWAGYDAAYIEKAFTKDFNIISTEIDNMFHQGEQHIADYINDMWCDFYKCNPQYKRT